MVESNCMFINTIHFALVMFLDSGYLLPKYIYIKVSQASQSNEKLGGIHGIKKADR